ncbi:MAG: hypothetical protein D6752_03560 [Candidatus Nitrosothermus koennekii]|nr:MAG: hypothetical protein D6752_03560 [Candidatus Nitrosothermus koennekii]
MKVITLLIIGLLLLPLSNADNSSTISGILHIFYGYYNDKYTTVYILEMDDGMIQLDMSLYTDVSKLDSKYVTLEGVFDQDGIFHVSAIRILDTVQVENVESSVTGEQAWVTILARFADVPTTPKEPEFFDNLLYNDTYPSLNHYWQDVSYNIISITGATYGWYDLPNNKVAYTDPSDPLCFTQPDFAKLLEDMTALADPYVDFNDYIGINLIYNDEIGNCVWGGSVSLTIDGSTRVYRVTFLSPAGLEHKFFAHEMGHGFGLPHSSGPYNYPYDSEWDVMSKGSSCRIIDPEFKCLAVDTISYHKELLGWIPSSNICEIGNNTITTIRLYPLENMSNGCMMIKVPISIDQFYTIEYRQRIGYDINVPDDAVIIHHVVETRDRPAQVIDIDNNGNPNDEGAMWRVGETFSDESNNISITIIEDMGDSYIISVSKSTLDLNNYTSSFINNETLNALFILGDSNPHVPTEWGAGAKVNDLIGSIGLASKLGQLSSSGSTNQVLDTVIATYNTTNNNVSIDWNNIESNMIVVGGPVVNLLAYHYDKIRILPFYLKWIGDKPYIHSSLSNMDYTFSDNKDKDYAIIGLIHDNERDVLIAWGLSWQGTNAALQLLQHYDTVYNNMLHGKAVILEWTDSNNNQLVDINDNITIVETW